MKLPYLNTIRVVILAAWLVIAGGCEEEEAIPVKTTVEKMVSDDTAEQLEGLEEGDRKFGGG